MTDVWTLQKVTEIKALIKQQMATGTNIKNSKNGCDEITFERFCVQIKGTFVSVGGSWNLIAFIDLRVCLGEFIERDHGPVNPA